MKTGENKSVRAIFKSSCVFIWLSVAILIFSVSNPSSAQNRKIAIFGSSVANGSGDTTGTGGYAGIIGSMLEKRGWTVVNLSKGGDNTGKIMPRFEAQLLPEKPGFVIIGLSLGNEGIASADELTRNRNFERYRSGMFRLVELCRENDMYPVVVNCYARADFKEEQYAAIKKMNLIINTWDVPSINVLGPVDNGKGNWLEGYYHDKSHPDHNGHREMAYSFVPGLFDAIESGIPVPYKIRSNECLSVTQPSSSRPLSFTPSDPVHSFSVSFLSKSTGNGTIAAIEGDKACYLESSNGKIVFHAINGKVISADTTGENKGWQYVVITHQYATGRTAIYVNGRFIDEAIGLIDLKEFVLGGAGSLAYPAPDSAWYKDLLIYRSVLNSDEVRALYYDQLLQSSLEVYAPLNDREFRDGSSAANYAQSLSKLMINGDYKPVIYK